MKRRTPIELAVGPHSAAVARNDPVHQGQTDPSARKLVIMMQALKHAE
jgi:hypothetical protein